MSTDTQTKKNPSAERALVQFVREGCDGQVTTVQTDFPASAQRAAAAAVDKGWDRISSKIDEVNVIVVASIPRGGFVWAIHRGSPCWEQLIQPKIDALRKAAKPALLDDPRYVAALEHVNNVLTSLGKEPVTRLQPSNSNDPFVNRACNCPISTTINKAMDYPTLESGAYDYAKAGIAAATGVSARTRIRVSRINTPVADFAPKSNEVYRFVRAVDNYEISDEEIAEALEYSDE